MPLLQKDRLFPQNKVALDIAQDLYENVVRLPIISPHGHCDPSWFSGNKKFPDPSQLFVVPDHYILRMLVSQGLTLSELGVKSFNNKGFFQR